MITDCDSFIYKQRNGTVQGCRTYGSLVRNGTQKYFLGTRHSLLSQLFISFARPASPYCAEYVFIHIYLSAHKLYELPLLPNSSVVKHFYTNQELSKYCLDRGLLVASRGHFSDNDCVSVASRAVWGQSTSCVPRSLFRWISISFRIPQVPFPKTFADKMER